jgi:hypothetical protein
MGRWIITLALLAGCFALGEWLPFSPYFRNVDTMIHEFGHALTTLVFSGEVRYIHVYEDHSGVTLSAVHEGWQFIPVALSGYFIASLFAVLLFYLHRHGKHRLGLFIVTVVACVSLILFVRNEYGARWLLGFIGVNAVAFLVPIRIVRIAYYLFLAFLTLVESVFGTVTIAVLSWVDPENAGDATNLASATGLPAFVWGGLFLLFSLWAAKKAVGYFATSPKKKSIWASSEG